MNIKLKLTGSKPVVLLLKIDNKTDNLLLLLIGQPDHWLTLPPARYSRDEEFVYCMQIRRLKPHITCMSVFNRAFFAA